jgi:hypothetical protein
MEKLAAEVVRKAASPAPAPDAAIPAEYWDSVLNDSVKYGSYRAPPTLDVSSTPTEDEDIVLMWIERGGPPMAKNRPPSRRAARSKA